jgi:nucleotide-binding universal stress UspA family protein
MADGRRAETVRQTSTKEPDMFETIVWATDGSDLADRALPLVTELALVHDSKIVVLHANELLAGRFGAAPMLADESELRASLGRRVDELRAEGFEADLKIQTGIRGVADLIAEAAEELDADVIVVGSHGRGAVGGALLGSVAKRLLHIAKCPVLVATPVHANAEVATVP